MLAFGLRRMPASIRLAHRYGSTRSRIGLFDCDYAKLTYRLAAPIVLGRLLLAIGSALATAALCGSSTIAIVFGVVAWGMTGWRGKAIFPLYLVALMWVAFVALPVLWVQLGGFFIYRVLRILFASWMTNLMSSMVLASPARFVGRFVLLRALFSTTMSNVLLAVDKSGHDDRIRASFFVDATLTTASPRVKPILLQCAANSAAAELEFQRALALAKQAEELAVHCSGPVRGWCALQFGDILALTGRQAAAEDRWRTAASLLSYRSRTRYWRIEADLRLAQALTSTLSDLGRCTDGLERLCAVRRCALRSASTMLLDRTEFLLLRLMHEADNTASAAEHFETLHAVTQGDIEADASVTEHGRQKLLHAALLVELCDRSDDPAATLERAARLCDGVLGFLSRTHDPLTEANVFALLAAIRSSQNRPDESLANALAALNAVQRVRYQLPTTSWRTAWAGTHAHTYALALRLAAAAGDSRLVAELLEVVRAQAVPLDNNNAGALLRAIFTSLVSDLDLPEADARERGADPVLPNPTILIDGASWVGGLPHRALDLDIELAAMYPGCWYWICCRVDEIIHHAMRSPAGTWHCATTDHRSVEPLLRSLARQLPIHLPGEDFPEQRLHGAVLMTETATTMTREGPAGEVFFQLFGALGRALIPRVLADGLAQPGMDTLVVAPTGALATIPVAALLLADGTAVLTNASVVHVPSIASIARRRAGRGSVPPTHRNTSHVLAVLVPHCAPGQDPDGVNLTHAETTEPPNSKVIRGPLDKAEFAMHLSTLRTASGTLLLTGHVRYREDDASPATMGFVFHDGLLSLRDFYSTTPDGTPTFQLPPRTILAGCASIGIANDVPGDLARTHRIHTPEWLGFAAAALFGGAEHVVCTLFEVPDSSTTRRIDLALVEAMRKGHDPARSLRDIQLRELRRWESGDEGGSLALASLAYAYVGLGHTT
ncbi:CHAT domain-containing protein [Nocardia rosealba]|uniref:CHAT domain-containing protein n=1 Tax=Nocardia rosealba TaxID=2878563 RepID=UPI001CD929DB|nr:CHAT domain-containing protein [Nocardia rosealba]MCA2208392.1 CHAT domain-containing protein [Nocardia rosealba]